MARQGEKGLIKPNPNYSKACGFRVADPKTGKRKALQPNVSAGQRAFIVEVLQVYSSRGRHYETRFDKILAARDRSVTSRMPHKPRERSSAKITYRLTTEDRQAIAARYRTGVSSRVLAEEFVVSKTSVILVLREAGAPIRNQGLSSTGTGEAIRLYEAGHSLAAIGKQMDVSADTIRKALIDQGVRLRSPWDRPRLA